MKSFQQNIVCNLFERSRDMEIGHQSQLYKMPPSCDDSDHHQLPTPACPRHTRFTQRTCQCPQIFIILFQEALEIFNTNSLAKYLQAVEELKRTVPDGARLQLEEQSRDASAKWEVRAPGPWACGSGPGLGMAWAWPGTDYLESHHRLPLSTL